MEFANPFEEYKNENENAQGNDKHDKPENIDVNEPCPMPINVNVGGCQDSVVVNLGEVGLQSLGRIVQFDVTVKNVCPHKRVALAVVLTETDNHGIEHQRGMKAFTVPAHDQSGCRSVQVKCIKFVVPEDLDVFDNSKDTICNERKFKARVLANYLDTDFRCCESVVTL